MIGQRLPHYEILDKLGAGGTVHEAGESEGQACIAMELAPEQLRGQEADTRSDVWSLGVVLCEMASGRRWLVATGAAASVAAATRSRSTSPTA